MRALLILGGTAEARELAGVLHGRGVPVVSSLAGRVAAPRLPPGEVRIGGFGGPDALATWLREHEVAALVDATHPFAKRISASAVRAADQAGVPLLRLERPGWTEGPGDRWHWVNGLDEAAARVSELGSRVLLTTGRQGLAAFAGVSDVWFFIRCVDPPDDPLPRRCEVLLALGRVLWQAGDAEARETYWDAAVSARERQLLEEARQAPVDCAVPVTTGVLAQRTRDVRLADAGRSGDEDVAMFGDPLARGQLADQRPIELAPRRVLDVLETRLGHAQLRLFQTAGELAIVA